MKIRNKAIPAVYIILEKDNQILLGRRLNTGYEDGNYQMPAGHVEEEWPTEALIREMKEEIGIDIELKDIEFVHFMYRAKHDATGDRVDLFFRVKIWKGEPTNMEPNKCDDLSWFPINNLPKNIIFHAKKAVEEIYKGVNFQEIRMKP